MFKDIFDWLLDKGLVSTALILAAIYFMVFGLAIWLLHLYHKYLH